MKGARETDLLKSQGHPAEAYPQLLWHPASANLAQWPLPLGLTGKDDYEDCGSKPQAGKKRDATFSLRYLMARDAFWYSLNQRLNRLSSILDFVMSSVLKPLPQSTFPFSFFLTTLTYPGARNG